MNTDTIFYSIQSYLFKRQHTNIPGPTARIVEFTTPDLKAPYMTSTSLLCKTLGHKEQRWALPVLVVALPPVGEGLRKIVMPATTGKVRTLTGVSFRV
jgi:hypothetical protein